MTPRRSLSYPRTPDGKYFVVRGRLWRVTNPHLSDTEKSELTKQLMQSRRAVRSALRAQDGEAERVARAGVRRAKVLLGERGPVWWTDNTPDYTRHLIKDSPYVDWYAHLPDMP